MSGAGGGVLLVALRGDADDGGRERIAALLGPREDSLGRHRWLGQRLLVAWPRGFSELGVLSERDQRVIDGLRADVDVRTVLPMAPGERLVSHWIGASPRTTLQAILPSASGTRPALVAGPCTVENEGQLLETAVLAAEAGADGLRAGIYKPRTSPYSFAGLGDAGLDALRGARERTGLPVATEVLEIDRLDRVVRCADIVQIGSRNMFNTPLLFEAGYHPSGTPVLLKRGLGATADELLWAAEYVLLGRFARGHGRPALVLCERGVRSFDPKGRFSFDPAVLPWLRARTHLPLFVDPSHAAGERDWVVPLALAAAAAGADGLLVEVHPRPTSAWCDGRHALDGPRLHELARRLRAGPWAQEASG